MAVKVYKPTTPGRRGMTSQDNSAITAKSTSKKLLKNKVATSGRSKGKITIRHRGGGVKQHYRVVDFKGVRGSHKVIAIEYDPNRSARIALIENEQAQKSYVIAPAKLKIGDQINTDEKTVIKSGNRMKLANIRPGTTIYNIELTPGKGGQIARSAGAAAVLSAKDKKYAQIRLPSGEVRQVSLECYGTIGSVGNEAHQNIKWGKAGRKRRMGRRPSVRGKAMNPADHPMGGGEGLSSPGRLPRTPWGKIAIGPKTRRRKATSKYIIRDRRDKRR